MGSRNSLGRMQTSMARRSSEVLVQWLELDGHGDGISHLGRLRALIERISALDSITNHYILSVGDGLFAMGVIASFFRLIYLCQISRYLGLLQLSLSRMVRVIFQFAFISIVMLTSFSVGMTMLYSSSFEAYGKERPQRNTTDPIQSLLSKGYHR